MQFVLLVTAAWSIGLGIRRTLALHRLAAVPADGERIAEWVTALSLVLAGVSAWVTESWLALVAGYAVGWAVIWMLPADTMRAERRTS